MKNDFPKLKMKLINLSKYVISTYAMYLSSFVKKFYLLRGYIVDTKPLFICSMYLTTVKTIAAYKL